jgi:C4-dicarboxylate-specific signal transduction histidine kinase
MQVFLNLTRNASRALQNSKRRELSVVVNVEEGGIKVRFHNTGPPVANPEMLFKPLQSAVPERGLGLYIARAMVRAFGGDLCHEPVDSGCCFTVSLEPSDVWYIFRE